MYKVRLWCIKRSRLLETVYLVTKPAIVLGLNAAKKVFGRFLDRPVIVVERSIKGFLFDCQMCGDCVLSKTGMSCPMNCPKNIRNGPCGGVRENGMCEVKPDMLCVWVGAWDGASRMKDGGGIGNLQPALDHRSKGTSSWLKLTEKRSGDE
ncbi:MAG: methylenetetrahydrofolate reductase C-terminal domain-containing protein [Devosiaceae bacterium]|nr:methylenetetrahydrofolate reductase C-terminal domain-containing protein [Devosiaceae bacterium]